MHYLIDSPQNPQLEMLLNYAKTLGIEVKPIENEEKMPKKMSFASLRLSLSTETNQQIDAEMNQIHNDWE